MPGSIWYIPWLYPAQSHPPPAPESVDEYQAPWPLPQFPQWIPPWGEQPGEPIPDEGIPIYQGWTMVFRTWSVDTYVTSFETEELPDDHFEDNEKPFPEFPPWRPPDHQSYYSDEEEAPHPEIDSRVLPIWVPWWPIPHLDYFNDLPEIITPDKYESPHEVPVWPILWPHFLWKEKQEIPAPGVEYVPPMYVPPPPKPYFMPPEIPFHIDIPNPTALCPPPCLRRPDRKC